MRVLIAFLVLVAAPAAAQPPVGQGPDGDWADVGRYREANLKLAATSTTDRVVFIGDSITEGWADQPLLKETQAFVGRGISGQTAAQMLVRFRTDVIDLRPAVVHIMGGTNDIAQNNGPEPLAETEGYLKSMIELARANGIRVIIGSVPPAADFWWHKGLNPAPKIRALNHWLRAYSESHKLIYADYWSVLAAPGGGMKPAFSEDGVHPNAAGYRAMRSVAEMALRRTLRRR